MLTTFDDFEAFGNALQGWSPVVRKLDAGPFRGQLLQVAVGPIRVAYTRLDSALEISGAAQPGFQSFGLPMPASSAALWCRKPTSARSVSVYEASGGFEAVTRPGFESLVLSASPEHLAELVQSLGIGALRDVLPAADVTACEPGPMRVVRHRLLGIVGALTRDASLAERPALRAALERVCARLLEALANRHQRPARAVAPHLRQRALRRALAHVAALPDEPLAVRDLCLATGASERTLRRAFTEHLGVSPKAYLRARRLNGVYRKLRGCDATGTRVNEAAHCWGFWHMGQFAADYRRLFGELPSATLARPGRDPSFRA